MLPNISGTLAAVEDATKHLDIGREMLAKGNLIEALSHFDIAVGMFPCYLVLLDTYALLLCLTTFIIFELVRLLCGSFTL